MSSSNPRSRLRDINNTGFGGNSNVEGGRLMNADGSTNLKKRGIPVWERTSIYHTLLRMPRHSFFLSIFIFYTSVNFCFAFIYMLTGIENLLGVVDAHTFADRFMEAFFFSSQTLTTVGYGRVSPSGMVTNCIASLESLMGILTFAVVTGLIYARFSRPKAYLLFSNNFLIAPYKGAKALMIRLCTYKNNNLTDVEAQFTLAIHENDNGKSITRFYPLGLEISKVSSLALSWTIVHSITEDSPVYNFTEAQISESRMELIVSIKAFDDHFSNIVQQRTSYTYRQAVYGAKFTPMFERAPDGEYTLLELDKISDYEAVVLPQVVGLV
ncbi:MAG: Inward rectifier potassium channel Irk [Taibaiella sp.]|nr:Inward rectifier potassium channel Irk [Taibaiella sp.]